MGFMCFHGIVYQINTMFREFRKKIRSFCDNYE